MTSKSSTHARIAIGTDQLRPRAKAIISAYQPRPLTNQPINRLLLPRPVIVENFSKDTIDRDVHLSYRVMRSTELLYCYVIVVTIEAR